MKKAKFIYNPEEICENYGTGWSHDNNAFYKQQKPGKGLTVYMKRFDAEDTGRVSVELTALGIFEAYINGIRIGEYTENGIVYDELKPGWTDYYSRVFSFTYDITPFVKKKDNLLVIYVSKGWWGGRICHGIYQNRPTVFCGEITLSLANGEERLISTDTDWDTAIGGPVLAADIYDGEYYDARITPAYDDPAGFEWKKSALCEHELPKVVSPMGPPIRVRERLTLSPISATVYEGTVDNGSDFGKINVKKLTVGNGCEKTVLKAGETLILDLAQNHTGCPEITFKAKRGAHVMGHVAELLNDSGRLDRGNDGPEGSLYVANYRSARAKINYIASGNGVETYRPLHTFYGYRYLMIEADSEVEIISAKALVIGSDIKETGSMTTSNAEVNQLISNILWGQRSNYLSIPTDCPQRDERLGWTGDTQIFCGAGAYNGDILEFMRKWIVDLIDSQKFSDGFCDVIPKAFGKAVKVPDELNAIDKASGGAAWGDAAIVVPYKMWLMYGDKSILKTVYESLEKYMAMLEKFGMRGPVPRYGDWLNYDVTPKDYISICYYYYDAVLMKKISSLLGKKDRRDHYAALSEKIRNAYIEKYYVDGEFTVRTQTGYLLPVYFGILVGDLRKKAIKELKKKIIDNDYTLSTGFVGTGCLCQALSTCGLDDLAYSLLLQTKDPSWLYSVRQGATTVWERRNSYTKATGFGDVGMNSFNHYAYGAVLEWMYSCMAGIAPNSVSGGFKRMTLRPTPDLRRRIPKGQSRMTSCSASYDSYVGRIESAWDTVDGETVYKFVIPEGVKAKVCIIVNKGRRNVEINGVAFDIDTLGAVFTGGRLTFELGAGKYTVK